MDDTAKTEQAEQVHELARPAVVSKLRELCELFAEGPDISRALEKAETALKSALSVSSSSSDDTSKAIRNVKQAILGLRILEGCSSATMLHGMRIVASRRNIEKIQDIANGKDAKGGVPNHQQVILDQSIVENLS